MKQIIFVSILFLSLIANAEETATQNTAPTAAASVETASEAKPIADDSKMKTDNRKESEIALNFESHKKTAENDSPLFKILFSISLVGIIGTGAFFFLRKYAIPKAMKTQTQIKILQQHYLGPKKSLAIVRVAGESILIGITDHNINMIKSLSLLDDEVPEEAPAHFSKVFNSFGLPKAELSESEGNEDKEDFSFGGIKDVVSKRLKGMRNLE